MGPNELRRFQCPVVGVLDAIGGRNDDDDDDTSATFTAQRRGNRPEVSPSKINIFWLMLLSKYSIFL